MDWLGWLAIFFGVVLLTGVALFVLARVRWRQGGRAMEERIEQVRAQQGARRAGRDVDPGGVVLPGEVIRPHDPWPPTSGNGPGHGSQERADHATGRSVPVPWAQGQQHIGATPQREILVPGPGPTPVGRRVAGVAYGCLAGPLVGLGMLGLAVCALIALFR